jgi:hypothetical protein
MLFDPADLTGPKVGIHVLDDAGALADFTSGALHVLLQNASLTVTATDFDIRNLTFADDKVDVGGSVVALDAGTLAALENITVSGTDIDIRDLAFATDKVDVSGSTINTDFVPGLSVKSSVANTATALPASALTGRKRIMVQNKDTNSIFIGASDVTTANGLEVAKGATLSLEIGAGVTLYAISAAGSAPVRVLEQA